MAFYKALENVELKKYSEATAEDFGVVFIQKAHLKQLNYLTRKLRKSFSFF